MKKVPVRRLRKNQPVKKTFSPQGSPGRKQPPRAVKNKQGRDEIEVRRSLYLIFKSISCFIMRFLTCFLPYFSINRLSTQKMTMITRKIKRK